MFWITDKAERAELTVKMLLEIGAVQFRPEQPFRFTSGLASPVYVDCRKLMSYPRIRRTVTELAAATIFDEIGVEGLDSIAGGETAGIPFAAWIAERLALPMLYVRKTPKGFGRKMQIEGDYRDGLRTLLVEDLATDGRSKIHFCRAMREHGLEVSHSLVMFEYAIFSETEKILAGAGLKIHSLATWWDVLSFAQKNNVFGKNALAEIERFMRDPLNWSAQHGGTATIE